ncbi:hypothetical protein ACP70R_030012 [Stipagrostis hirtigluma subsp. patula]
MAKQSASTFMAIAVVLLLLTIHAAPVVHGARHVTTAVVRAPAAPRDSAVRRVAAPRGYAAVLSTNPGPSHPGGHTAGGQ